MMFVYGNIIEDVNVERISTIWKMSSNKQIKGASGFNNLHDFVIWSLGSIKEIRNVLE